MAEEKEENKIEKKPRVPRRNTNKRVQNKKETVEKCYLELVIVTFLSLLPIIAVIARGLILTFGLKK